MIVLNDNHNTFEGVAFTLSGVLPGVSYDQGMKLANTIHNAGRATVWSGHREQAELYWEELRVTGLTMAPLEQQLARAPVHDPAVRRLRGERRPDEAVALGFREQVGERVGRRLRVELHGELEIRFDDGVAAVALSARDERGRISGRRCDLDAGALRVMTEAVE